jgi:hypothetical protein
VNSISGPSVGATGMIASRTGIASITKATATV